MRKIVLVTIFSFLFLLTANSQYRVGGIDMEKLQQKQAQNKKNGYDSILKKYQDSLSAEFGKIDEKINAASEFFKICHGSSPLADSTRMRVRDQIVNLTQELHAFYNTAQKQLELKSNEIRAKILSELKEKIRPITYEAGYDIVIDLSVEKSLPITECIDITNLIIQKLNW